MYLTYVVYALCLGLLVWGGSFAGFRSSSFHEDSASLDVTKCVRGFAAIGVMLHHVSQEDAFQYASRYKQLQELPLFVNYGPKFVAIFFFFSGYGLIKSLNTKSGYLMNFRKNRLLKNLVVPFYTGILIYALWHVIRGDTFAPLQWVTNFLGLSMMNEYGWFPVVLIVLYLSFYIIFKNIKDRHTCFILMTLVVLAQGLFFCVNGHFAWWAGKTNWWLNANSVASAQWWMRQKVWPYNGEWWVNSQIAFISGMMISQNEAKFREWFSQKYWIKLALIFVAYIGFSLVTGMLQGTVGYWSEFSGRGPGIMNKLLCYISQLPQIALYVTIIYAILLKYHATNPVLRFFGNLSLETYMMNLIAIREFRFLLYNPEIQSMNYPVYKAGHWNLALYTAAVLAATTVMALIYRWINRNINKLIK